MKLNEYIDKLIIELEGQKHKDVKLNSVIPCKIGNNMISYELFSQKTVPMDTEIMQSYSKDKEYDGARITFITIPPKCRKPKYKFYNVPIKEAV